MIADLEPASSLIDDQCKFIWLSRRDLWPFDPVKDPGPGPEARMIPSTYQSLMNNLCNYYEMEHESDDVESELYKELALALYQRGMLSSGKASALCGLTLLQFEDLLGQRRVLRHYGEEELQEDLRYAGCSL